ncbi:DUF3263 domain-containing protein [Microbacterium sp. A1-JK]|uniref:DUF3263 domain-containing protein n=1 Tax=Microbacterium sp. A1-JK TaxID=3177516 RepID=UPI003889C662
MPTMTELDFEEKWGRDPRRHAAKLEACRTDLGIPPARYFQLLGRAIDTQEALALNPMLARRLIRQRAELRQSRERRVATGVAARPATI